MLSDDHPLTPEEFDSIYSRVPRLTVEVIVKNKAGEICMTLRDIEPCKGQWHLPGGTVRFGEPLLEAVKRVARRELAVEVKTAENKGYIEYPSHYQKGLDDPVGLVFEVTDYEGEPHPDSEAAACDWFSKVPAKIHGDQDTFLVEHGYLRR